MKVVRFMKKFGLVLATTLFLVSLVNAQEETLKAQSGDLALEVNAAPFSSNPIRISKVNLRFFDDNRAVFRLGLSLNTRVSKPGEETTFNTFEFKLTPGGEKHFEGTGRLSPYIGGELILAAKFSNAKFENSEDDIDGAWDQFGQEQGFLQIGANYLMGADYYMAKKIYVGVEIGYGFVFTKFSDIESDDIFDGNEIKGGSLFELGPNYNGSLRLGFTF